MLHGQMNLSVQRRHSSLALSYFRDFKISQLIDCLIGILDNSQLVKEFRPMDLCHYVNGVDKGH